MTETMQTIKDLMKHQHISQRSMAEKVGVTEATMSRWINGTRNPDIQYVEKMAETCGCRLVVLDESRQTGRWIRYLSELGVGFWMCSVCRCMEKERSLWCPNCGSRNGGKK